MLKKIILALFLSLIFTLNLWSPHLVKADWVDDVFTNDNATTFTQFDGTFTPPDESLYPKELTQAKNVRDYIKNVLNFALGFLGIVAIAAIIYGGYLYVVSGGTPETAEKGKKNVTYALIGILIILVSYATVNTILFAPGGKAPGVTHDSGDDQQGSETPQVNFVASSVSTIAKDVTTNYDHYVQVKQDVDSINSLMAEAAAYDPNTGTTTGDAAQVNQTYTKVLNKIINSLKKIQQFSGDLSETEEYSKTALDYISQVLINANSISFFRWTDLFNQFFITAYAVPIIDIPDLDNPQSIDAENCKTATETKIEDVFKDTYLPCYINNITISNANDYNTTISDFIAQLNELEKTIGQQESAAVVDAFNDAKNALEDIKIPTTTTDFAPPNNADVKKAVEALKKLYDAVQKLKFFMARITASALEGNAPLVIRLDGLKSSDPLKREIKDEQFNWIFPTETTKAKCLDNYHPVVSCTFTAPGTYQIKLEVDDAAGATEDIGKGIANVKIVINPPTSQLVLEETKTSTTLVDYSTAPSFNKIDYNITVADAKNGVIFNACDSKSGDDQDIAYYSWDYGDKTPPETNLKYSVNATDACQKTHFYSQKGTYNLVLGVTDPQGNKDQAMVAIHVTEIAARIQTSPDHGTINTTFTFDGSGSSTVNGTIKTYAWTFTKNNTDATSKVSYLEGTTNRDSTIKVRFSETGQYTVGLAVTDSTDAPANDSVIMSITSRPPVAKYTYNNSDSAHPGQYLFDASGSYDLDGENLNYVWSITKPADCVGNGCTIQTNNAVTTFIDFPKVGDYTVKLVVNKLSDTTAQNPGIYEQSISVPKVLSAELTANPAVVSLSQGKASVTFTAKSNQPAIFDLDSGDGATEKGENTQSTLQSGVPLTHVYTKSGLKTAKLTVVDQQGVNNDVTTKLAIGDGVNPIAVFKILANGQEIPDSQLINYIFYGNTKITFDASPSVNVQGNNNNLSYIWKFPPEFYFASALDTSSQKINFVHETYDGQKTTYNVQLIVRDTKNNTASSPYESQLNFDSAPPSVRMLKAFIKGESDKTPLDVEVEAVDAKDPDGQIRQFAWWYINADNQKGPVQITTEPKTIMTINSEGEEGTAGTYKFFVKLTDDDGVFYQLPDDQAPELTVTYGSNKPPVAKISVAGSNNVSKGSEVTFLCDCKDPEGGTLTYNWDVDGDQDWNNNGGFVTESTKINTYDIARKGGQPYQVRVWIKDDQGGSTISDPIPVYVETESTPPHAEFSATVLDTATRQVQINPTSTKINAYYIDSTDPKACPTREDICPRYVWDFDFNDNDDDDKEYTVKTEGTLNQPTFTVSDFYKENKKYKIKLTVYDSEGTSDTYEQVLDLTKPSTPAPKASFSYSTTAETQTQATVQLNASASESYDSDKRINQYFFDLDLNTDSDGNGNSRDDYTKDTPDSGKAIQSHAYNYGKYTVALKVMDDNGENIFIKDVNLTPPNAKAPVADFTYSLSGGTVYVNASNSQPKSGVSYRWDFDINSDTNNDGDPTNESEATTVTTSHLYQTDGNYRLKLTLTDSANPALSGTKVKTISVPPFGASLEKLEAKLTSDKDGDDGKIHLLPDTAGNDSITFDVNASTGGIVHYYLDKNIYFDTDKNGTKGDDIDLSETNFSPNSNLWEGVIYNKQWLETSGGKMGARLTVVDMDGNKDSVDREIVFETAPNLPPPTGAFNYEVSAIQEQSDGSLNITLKFKNNSVANSGTTLDESKYVWDQNLRVDTNGDTDAGNDLDSKDKDPTLVYHYYGNYNVKLTVCDKQTPSACDSVINSISLNDPQESAYEDIVAKLWGTPAPSYSDGKIHLKGDKGSITFDDGGSVGSTLNYFAFDKNTNFDSDGDGVAGNDENVVFKTRGTWTTDFEKSWGSPKPIIVKLTVKNSYGQKDSVTREIVFDDSGSANLRQVFRPEIILLLAIALVSVVVLKKVGKK